MKIPDKYISCLTAPYTLMSKKRKDNMLSTHRKSSSVKVIN